MYELFSQISAWLSQPLASIAYSTSSALVAALFLGLIGAMAPCQISANVGAITYFGNRMARQKVPWIDFLLYLLGKILVFGLLGLAFWAFGKSFSSQSLPVLAYARKVLGPLLVFIGLFAGLGLDQVTVKQAKKWGGRLQKAAGVVLLLLGVSDTLTYWTL